MILLSSSCCYTGSGLSIMPDARCMLSFFIFFPPKKCSYQQPLWALHHPTWPWEQLQSQSWLVLHGHWQYMTVLYRACSSMLQNSHRQSEGPTTFVNTNKLLTCTNPSSVRWEEISGRILGSQFTTIYSKLSWTEDLDIQLLWKLLISRTRTNQLWHSDLEPLQGHWPSCGSSGRESRTLHIFR